jgi:hypothetical protein
LKIFTVLWHRQTSKSGTLYNVISGGAVIACSVVGGIGSVTGSTREGRARSQPGDPIFAGVCGKGKHPNLVHTFSRIIYYSKSVELMDLIYQMFDIRVITRVSKSKSKNDIKEYISIPNK